jgi:hypothetical protein
MLQLLGFAEVEAGSAIPLTVDRFCLVMLLMHCSCRHCRCCWSLSSTPTD